MAGYMPAPGINENDLTYVEKGDYASQAIPKGAFVEWNGKVRTTKNAILQGAELSASLFDEVNSGGALNQLADHLAQFSIKFPRYTSSQTMQTLPWTAPYDCMLILCLDLGTSSGTWAHIYINNKYAYGAPTGISATPLFLKQGDEVKKGQGAGSFSVAASAYYHLGDET